MPALLCECVHVKACGYVCVSAARLSAPTALACLLACVALVMHCASVRDICTSHMHMHASQRIRTISRKRLDSMTMAHPPGTAGSVGAAGRRSESGTLIVVRGWCSCPSQVDACCPACSARSSVLPCTSCPPRTGSKMIIISTRHRSCNTTAVFSFLLEQRITSRSSHVANTPTCTRVWCGGPCMRA
jgi:hypothetical protein